MKIAPPSLVATRNERMDFFKGVLILGVIWGHTIQNFCVGSIDFVSPYWNVQTFDMPMFMIISGFFLRSSLEKKTFIEILKDKATTLLLPALIWGVVVIGRAQSLDSFSALYFLWVVLFSSLVVATVAKTIKSILWQLAVFALITVVLNFTPVWLWNASYLFPFFCLGYFVNALGVNASKWFRYGSIWLFLFALMLCFWKKDYTVWATKPWLTSFELKNILIVLYRYVIGFAGCGAFVVLFNILYTYYCRRVTPLFRFIVKCGKETLAIYILQDIILFKVVRNIVLILTDKLGYNPFVIYANVLDYVLAPVFAFVITWIIMWGVNLIKGFKYTKYAFGGKFLK